MSIGNIIALVAIGLSLLGNGFVIAMTCVIKFNDLHWLTKKIDGMDKKVDKHSEEITIVKEDVAHLKGKLCKVSRKRKK